MPERKLRPRRSLKRKPRLRDLQERRLKNRKKMKREPLLRKLVRIRRSS